MAEMASNCKKQKIKWARAGFEKFFVTPVVRSEVLTPVSVPEVMEPVMVEVTEELVEAPLVPACSDSLQSVLAEVVEEEVDTPQVLESKKARILPCTVELFSYEFQMFLPLFLLLITLLPLWSQLIRILILLLPGWRL